MISAVLLAGFSAFAWSFYSQTKDTLEPLLTERPLFEVPFQTGEQLRYEVNWKPLFLLPAFKAGEVTLNIKEDAVDGVDTYRISGWARSEGTLSKVAGIQVRNYFESDIDRSNFRSYRSLQKTRQGKRQRDIELVFDYEGNRTLVKETDVALDPPKELRNEVLKGIPAPVIDILSVFYVARLRALEPEDEYLLYLNNQGKFDRVRVLAEDWEKVETDVGTFDTVKLSTQGGLFRQGGDFRIWYSRGDLRLPVKFEADVKFGKVYGTLIEVETPTMARGVIQSN